MGIDYTQWVGSFLRGQFSTAIKLPLSCRVCNGKIFCSRIKLLSVFALEIIGEHLV